MKISLTGTLLLYQHLSGKKQHLLHFKCAHKSRTLKHEMEVTDCGLSAKDASHAHWKEIFQKIAGVLVPIEAEKL